MSNNNNSAIVFIASVVVVSVISMTILGIYTYKSEAPTQTVGVTLSLEDQKQMMDQLINAENFYPDNYDMSMYRVETNIPQNFHSYFNFTDKVQYNKKEPHTPYYVHIYYNGRADLTITSFDTKTKGHWLAYQANMLVLMYESQR